MSLALHLPLHRRPKFPPAPAQRVRVGLVCHCGAINHAVGIDAEIAARAELALARLRNQPYLVAALATRLESCPNIGPAGVSL